MIFHTKTYKTVKPLSDIECLKDQVLQNSATTLELQALQDVRSGEVTGYIEILNDKSAETGNAKTLMSLTRSPDPKSASSSASNIPFMPVECVTYFEADIYSWATLYGPCNHTFFAYIAMFLSDVIILITIIVDAVAFYRIVTYLKGRKCQKANATQQRSEQEISFFKQTCVSTVVYAFFIVTSYIKIPVSRLTQITYTWLAILTLDGLVFLYFNRRLLIKQNAVGFHTNTTDLRTKAVKNDTNATIKCATANNHVNITSTKM
ncbi:hypothetical protein LOAG_17648 [Loa loa]|uniref:7TM GPCR serpentine receptor class x (Srx) domain-containing protein n=1 Tax=Loa loa TaxID=7209 RepID=A0A1S0UJX9_LOALO|nr:hypothetical protein LOAG_17648 [Loa loa]EJD75157.1 hypothetical protein LOAG_17648 [Loa loa]